MTAVLINANPALQNAKLAMGPIIMIAKAVKALIIENFFPMNAFANMVIMMTDLFNALIAIILGMLLSLNKIAIVKHAQTVVPLIIARVVYLPIIGLIIQALIPALAITTFMTTERLLIARLATILGSIELNINLK